MKRIAMLSVVSLFTLAGCEDKPTRVAPTAPPAPSLSISSADEAQSTVCVAYAQELEQAKAELAANPDDADVKLTVAAYERQISASCK